MQRGPYPDCARYTYMCRPPLDHSDGNCKGVQHLSTARRARRRRRGDQCGRGRRSPPFQHDHHRDLCRDVQAAHRGPVCPRKPTSVPRNSRNFSAIRASGSIPCRLEGAHAHQHPTVAGSHVRPSVTSPRVQNGIPSRKRCCRCSTRRTDGRGEGRTGRSG